MSYGTMMIKSIADVSVWLFVLLFLFFSVAEAFSQGKEISDLPHIKAQSAFSALGVYELRSEKDRTAPVRFRTLNHEGGTKVRVLEVVSRDDGGVWLWVLLTSPMWVDSGEWLSAYTQFLLYLPNTAIITDFVP